MDELKRIMNNLNVSDMESERFVHISEKEETYSPLVKSNRIKKEKGGSVDYRNYY